MEASACAAAAASMTDILGSAGQSLDGLSNLRKLVGTVEDATETATALLALAARLEERVDGIRCIVQQFAATRLGGIADGHAITTGNGSGIGNGKGHCNGGGTPGPTIGPRLWLALGELERKMRECAYGVRFVGDKFTSKVDESRSLKRTWKEAKMALDGTLNAFSRQIAEYERDLANLKLTVLMPSLRNKEEQRAGSAQAAVDAGSIRSDASTAVVPSATSGCLPSDLSALRGESTPPAAESGSSSATSITTSSNVKSTRRKRLAGSTRNQKTQPQQHQRQYRHHQSRQQQHRRLHSHSVYSCDALSGIDDAAEQGQREDGAFSCVYCGRRFAHDDETAPHRLGVHLLRAHSFGLCNLNCTFSGRASLLNHLKSFHGWTRTGLSNGPSSNGAKSIDNGTRGSLCNPDEVDPLLLDKLFLLSPARSWKKVSPRLLALEAGREQPPRSMVLAEREETGLLNLLVLNQILRCAGLEVDISPPSPPTPNDSPDVSPSSLSSSPGAAKTKHNDPAETDLAHQLCVALSKLDKLLLQDNDSGSAEVVNGDAAAETTGSDVIDVAQLMYHAACVQQELAISNGDELLRHEDLYSADQYRIDDLANLRLPRPTARPVWRLAVRSGSAPPMPAAADQTLRRPSIRDLKMTPLPRKAPAPRSFSPAASPSGTGALPGPFRSFRDAVRYLGRMHMAETGEKSYVAIMPKLLRDAANLMRERRIGDQRQRRGQRDESDDKVQEPLTERNLARFDDQDRIQCTGPTPPPADKKALDQQRLRWMTDPSLDWWFLGMLGASASFRRLVRSGRAFVTAIPKKKSKRKPEEHEYAPIKPQLTPYTWAATLLSSYSGNLSPLRSPTDVGDSTGFSNNNSACCDGGNGSGSNRNHTPSNGEAHEGSRNGADVPRTTESTSPAVSLVRADHGSISSGSSSSSEECPEQEEGSPRQQQQQRQLRSLLQKEKQKELGAANLSSRWQEKGKWVERPQAGDLAAGSHAELPDVNGDDAGALDNGDIANRRSDLAQGRAAEIRQAQEKKTGQVDDDDEGDWEDDDDDDDDDEPSTSESSVFSG